MKTRHAVLGLLLLACEPPRAQLKAEPATPPPLPAAAPPAPVVREEPKGDLVEVEKPVAPEKPSQAPPCKRAKGNESRCIPDNVKVDDPWME